jgi:hypothetical protein
MIFKFKIRKINLFPVILLVYKNYEDEIFSQNNGRENSDAGESPKRKNTTYNM